MIKILLIGIGGALGSILRYLVSSNLQSTIGSSFPYGTMIVNVTGSFLVAVIFVLLIDRFYYFSSELRSLLIVGFMGGYTTFSSFSLETLTLIENGEIGSAVLNVIITVVLCLSATFFGIIVGRLI